MRRLLTVHDSSNVKMIGYDQDHDMLYAVYHATPDLLHRFEDVSARAFAGIVSASSLGQALANVVKGKRYTKAAIPKEDAELFPGVPTPRTVEVTVPRHVAQAARGPLPLAAEPQLTDEDAFNAVTNRPKRTKE